MRQHDRRHPNGLRQVYDFLWDGDDRLRSVTERAVTRFSALYDGDGLRVQKTDTHGGLGLQTHHFSYGPGGLLHEDNPTTVYTPGFGHRSNGVSKFYHVDWLGSTRYTSDATGNGFPAALRYDAYGNRSATGGTDPYHSTDLQFAGAFGYQTEWSGGASDPGLGLQYLEQRYYDPAVGRFLSPDPIGMAGGLNLYAYTANPVGMVDPTGLAPWYDRYGAWLNQNLREQQAIVNDFYTGSAVGVGVATVVNSGLELVVGQLNPVGSLVHLPGAIGNWGRGTGTFVGDPTLENLAGVGEDLMLPSGLYLGGRGAVGALRKFAVATRQKGSGASTACLQQHEQIQMRSGGEGGNRIPGRPFRGIDAPERAYKHLEKYHGLDPDVAGTRLHILKKQGGLGATDPVAIGRTGDVYNAVTGERLGSLTDRTLGMKR